MPTNSTQEVTIDGLPRLIYTPTNATVRPEEAIPADVFPVIEEVFEGCSNEFLRNLWLYLWARNLRTLVDFNNPKTMELLTQAIKLALKQDGLSVIKRIKELQNVK